MNSSFSQRGQTGKDQKNVTGDQVPQMEKKNHNLVGPKEKQI